MQVVRFIGVLVLGAAFLGCAQAIAPLDVGPRPDAEAPDSGVDTGVLLDTGVSPDTGVHPDAGPLVLLQGSFETAGPAAGSGNLRLVEGGFERSGPSCNGTLCVSGGIVP